MTMPMTTTLMILATTMMLLQMAINIAIADAADDPRRYNECKPCYISRPLYKSRLDFMLVVVADASRRWPCTTVHQAPARA